MGVYGRFRTIVGGWTCGLEFMGGLAVFVTITSVTAHECQLGSKFNDIHDIFTE